MGRSEGGTWEAVGVAMGKRQEDEAELGPLEPY